MTWKGLWGEGRKQEDYRGGQCECTEANTIISMSHTQEGPSATPDAVKGWGGRRSPGMGQKLVSSVHPHWVCDLEGPLLGSVHLAADSVCGLWDYLEQRHRAVWWETSWTPPFPSEHCIFWFLNLWTHIAESGHLGFSVKCYDVGKVLIKYAFMKMLGYWIKTQTTSKWIFWDQYWNYTSLNLVLCNLVI